MLENLLMNIQETITEFKNLFKRKPKRLKSYLNSKFAIKLIEFEFPNVGKRQPR